MAHKFEIYKDKTGEFRVRFKYNSEVIWRSEGYSNKDSAQNLIDSIKKNAPTASVEDPTSDIEILKRRLENAPIPAADRIVSFDHNSAEFKEFKAAFEKLEESIRTSNDLGDLSSEEIEIAKSEISQIESEQKWQWVRPSHIWQVAKSTLLWIFSQSASAVIGTLALSALAALAKLLSITF
ncbi:YegP family protein [Shinella oryzae]|nr:YegP family protein [Shinella oryzae]